MLLLLSEATPDELACFESAVDLMIEASAAVLAVNDLELEREKLAELADDACLTSDVDLERLDTAAVDTSRIRELDRSSEAAGDVAARQS